jgi:predicted ester cyclase
MTDIITTTNKKIIQRLYKEVLANWQMSLVDELIAPQFISHDWPEGSPSGPEPFRNFYLNVIRSVLPDARYAVDDLIGDQDKVVVRWRLLGTHKGKFQDIAPTGRFLTLNGIAIYRLENNKVAERWVVTDLHGLLETMKASSNGEARQG